MNLHVIFLFLLLANINNPILEVGAMRMAVIQDPYRMAVICKVIEILREVKSLFCLQ